jgi:CelD/BcsL family acetyltransferase involved in cellulose biosynthesis
VNSGQSVSTYLPFAFSVLSTNCSFLASKIEEEDRCLLSQPRSVRGGKNVLRVELLREIPENSALLQRWNDLVLQMERPEVFYTAEWALAVQSAYHASRKPLLFLGYDGNDLVGVASLTTDQGQRTVSFLAGTTGDYCDFLSAPQRRAEFVELVFGELRRSGMRDLVFANLPAESGTSTAFRTAAKKHGFYSYIRPAYSCPQVDLGVGAKRDELKTTISRKRQLRRCLKAMEREGPVKCTFLHSWPEIQPALPSFVAAHVARFEAKNGNSFLYERERQFFMEQLARRFSGQSMTLTTLMIGDRPVAWSFGFQFHGAWFMYQTTFDIRSEENSPGYCVLASVLIEACGKESIRFVDLGLGAETYKEWFANGTRQTLHATLFSSPLGYVREVVRYRLATEVRRFPKLEAAIRNARSKLGS